MRALILAATIVGVIATIHATNAGPSSAPRELASLDTSAVSDEATQEAEDQIGLTKKARREIQRRLTALGFRTKVSGKFEESTRGAIAGWQEERGYPKTGFLNTAQHTALLEESKFEGGDHHRRGRAHHRHAIGGPIGAIGGVIGGLFRR
jgi:peptidoglycan hydrolase-like protein with peptidoglycan-binding domain